MQFSENYSTRIHRDIKLVTIEGRINYLVSKKTNIYE